VKWPSRHGLSASPNKPDAKQLGVCGEKCAYWYLRRLGYIFIARTTCHCAPRESWIWSDLMVTLLPWWKFAPAKRSKDQPSPLEPSITKAKHEVLLRTAHYVLRERHIPDGRVRFDVVAVENTPGHPPAVRLHQAALGAISNVFPLTQIEPRSFASLKAPEEYNKTLSRPRWRNGVEAPAWGCCFARTA
jgi:Holliday junction resolvase-like predicted endonuclease